MQAQPSVLVQQIKEVLAQQLQDGFSPEEVDRNVRIAMAAAKESQGLLLHSPSRGAVFELDKVLRTLEPKQHKPVAAAAAAATTTHTRQLKELLAEHWRDAEGLVRAPHTFAVLRQLPELQQLISLTAVTAVEAAAAPMHHLHIALEATYTLPPPSHASNSEVVAAMRDTQYLRESKEKVLTGEHADLFQHLSPHMRLALAADVAAGMLCPGQPPPPDTPEHAAALQFFVQRAFYELHSECEQQDQHEPSRPAAISRIDAVLQHREQQGYASTTTSNSSSSSSAASSGRNMQPCVPPCTQLRKWGLVPHVDLQLHLPPHLLLQRMLQILPTQAGEVSADQHSSTPDQGPGGLKVAVGQQGAPCAEVDCWTEAALRQLLRSSLKEIVCADAPAEDSSQQPKEQQQHQQQHQQQQRQSPDQLQQPSQTPLQVLYAQLAATLEAALQPACSGAGWTNDAVHSMVCAAYLVVLQFLADQLAAGGGADSVLWQQAVPLQALWLLAAVRQLEAAGAAAVDAAANAAGVAADVAGPSPEPCHVSAFSRVTAAAAALVPPNSPALSAAAAAQQRLVHMLLSLLQQVQEFRACNAAFQATESNSSSSVDHSSSSNSASTWPIAGQRVPPHKFFAADGPLSCNQSHHEQPCAGVGLWWRPASGHSSGLAAGVSGPPTAQPPPTATAAAGSSNAGSSGADDSSSSSSSMNQAGRGVADTAWAALVAAGLSQPLLQEADIILHNKLDDPSINSSLEGMLLRMVRSASLNEFAQSNPVVMSDISQAARFLDSQGLGTGLDATLSGMLRCVSVHGMCALLPHSIRHQTLQNLGAAMVAAEWDNHMLQTCPPVPGLPVSIKLLPSGPEGHRLVINWQQATAASNQGQQLADWDQWGRCDSCSVGSSSSHNDSGNGSDNGRDSSRDSSDRRSSSSSSSRAEVQSIDDYLTQGRCALRHMVLRSTDKLQALCNWLLDQATRQMDARVSVAGSLLHDSPAGPDAAAPAATSSCNRPEPQLLHTSSSSRGDEGVGQATHRSCNLCQQHEQEQQQQRASGLNSSPSHPSSSSTSTSSSSVDAGCWPVAYDDPYLWRRLLWELLGKLSPAAQACYANRQGMCPHSTSTRHWHFVLESILHSLWSPAPCDLVDLSLCCRTRPEEHRERSVRQYSRALNRAFVQGYHPSTTLLSKQVLLALSPLHHQVLPPPEVAHFLPSSFMPAIGKALQQQLFEEPVLDGFEHESCKLQLWHVWWHVGLRVYATLQQQQQQQVEASEMQRSGAQTTSACSLHPAEQCSSTVGCPAVNAQADHRSSSSSSNHTGLTGDAAVEELYLDNNARLFAVGYATRQLSGLPAHASPAALREHLLQQNAAATALHSQMLLVAAHSARLKEALVRPDADLAAEMAADTGLWGDVAAAVSMTDTLVTGLPQLLAAASGPRDLLIPPGQQRLRPSAGTGVQSTQTSGCLATIHYLKHCPDSTQPATCPLQQQQRLQEDALQQVLSSPNAARYCLLPEAAARRSDVSDLTLQSPVPLEALADPEVWWRWQQALLQLHACDVCGAETTEDEVVTCSTCSCAVYCSSKCMQQDAAVHAAMCEKLWRAGQRYAAADATESAGSSFPVLAQLLKPCGAQEVGHLASPCLTAGPAFPHGRNLVPLASYVKAAGASMGNVRQQIKNAEASE